MIDLDEFLPSDQDERDFPILYNPFVKFILPLILGIYAAYKFQLNFATNYLALFLAFLLVILMIKRLSARLKTLFVYLFIFATAIKVYNVNTLTKYNFPQKSTAYLVTLLHDPRYSNKKTKFPAQVEMFLDSSGHWIKPTKNKIYVTLGAGSLKQVLTYGDRILVYGKLKEINNLGNPFEFDYKKFMYHNGIYQKLYSQRFKLIDGKGGSKILRFSHKLRRYLLTVYKKYGLPDKLYGIAGALTLGYRQELDRQTQRSFAHSGAMHILAVSGLHVGVLFALLLFLLKPVFQSRYKILAFLVIVFVLWAFAFLTGLSPSVRRSAFMFSLVALAKVVRRESNIYNTLAASAFFMLLFFPHDLFNVGFWLSYSAVLSIVYFQPMIYKWFFFRYKILDWIWGLFSVSIAAQLGTMPIGLYVFHQFPNYFLLTNLLAIPLATIILYLALLLFVVSPVAFLAKAVMFLFKNSLDLLYEGIKIIEHLPYSYTSGIYLSFSQMLLFYFVIFFITAFLVSKKKINFFLAVYALAFFFILGAYQKFSLTYPHRLIFYNVPRHNLQLKVEPQQITVLADTGLLKAPDNLAYFIEPYIARSGVKLIKYQALTRPKVTTGLDSNFFIFSNSTFYYSTLSKIYDFSVQHKINLEFVVLADNVYTKISDLQQLFDFKTVLFSSSNSYTKIKHWEEQAKKAGVNYIDISHGAVVFYPKAKFFRLWQN